MAQTESKNVELMLAAADGDVERVKNLLKEGAEVHFQHESSGMSVLMAAAGAGHLEVVKLLLEEGAPWNAVDREYLCAGDYAAKNGHQNIIDILLNHAVTCEMLLSAATESDDEDDEIPENDKNGKDVDMNESNKETAAQNNVDIGTRRKGSIPNDAGSVTAVKRSKMDSEMERLNNGAAGDGAKQTPATPLNAAYLASRLEYTEDGSRLVDSSTKLAVMMDWEAPLMARHAAWICHATSESDKCPVKVLNVGFGMGIVDKAIQKFDVKEHVILEAHPQVLEQMRATGWYEKPNVRIIEGRWQDSVLKLIQDATDKETGRFDGIFFDTYAEDDSDLRQFHKCLPMLLKPKTGRYSFYNGVCPDNVFFHGVVCETLRLQLARLGMTTVYEAMPVDVADKKLWQGLSSRYWYFDHYYLPKCTFVSNEVDQ